MKKRKKGPTRKKSGKNNKNRPGRKEADDRVQPTSELVDALPLSLDEVIDNVIKLPARKRLVLDSSQEVGELLEFVPEDEKRQKRLIRQQLLLMRLMGCNQEPMHHASARVIQKLFEKLKEDALPSILDKAVEQGLTAVEMAEGLALSYCLAEATGTIEAAGTIEVHPDAAIELALDYPSALAKSLGLDKAMESTRALLDTYLGLRPDDEYGFAAGFVSGMIAAARKEGNVGALLSACELVPLTAQGYWEACEHNAPMELAQTLVNGGNIEGAKHYLRQLATEVLSTCDVFDVTTINTDAFDYLMYAGTIEDEIRNLDTPDSRGQPSAAPLPLSSQDPELLKKVYKAKRTYSKTNAYTHGPKTFREWLEKYVDGWGQVPAHAQSEFIDSLTILAASQETGADIIAHHAPIKLYNGLLLTFEWLASRRGPPGSPRGHTTGHRRNLEAVYTELERSKSPGTTVEEFWPRLWELVRHTLRVRNCAAHRNLERVGGEEAHEITKRWLDQSGGFEGRSWLSAVLLLLGRKGGG